jgi:hypothetical protein
MLAEAAYHQCWCQNGRAGPDVHPGERLLAVVTIDGHAPAWRKGVQGVAAAVEFQAVRTRR